jgi:CBS domain containing-hemolysin-like protein
LVGPIQDEFDRELPQIIPRGQGRFLVDAACPIDDLIERCAVKVPEEIEADSTGGLVVELLGHIPDLGESIVVGDHLFTVIEAEPTRVRRIEVVRRHQPGGSSEPEDAATSDGRKS